MLDLWVLFGKRVKIPRCRATVSEVSARKNHCPGVPGWEGGPGKSVLLPIASQETGANR